MDTGALVGQHIALEPLGPEHVDALAAAAAIDRSAYDWTTVPDGTDQARAYVEEALAARHRGVALPYAVRRSSDGAIVGSTRFLGIEHWEHPTGPPDAVEIGSTWYSADAQGTMVNPEAKLLLLTRAFEDWRVRRVQLKTDARNGRSRAAIEKLGARFEGVLRNFQAGQGPAGAVDGPRDTAMFSILPAEWPEVRGRLLTRIPRGD